MTPSKREGRDRVPRCERNASRQADLFAKPLPLPDGFRYEPELVSRSEERELVATLATLPFEAARYKEWTAKRRIVSYGGRYDFGNNELLPAAPVPPFLHELRTRLAAWAEVAPDALEHATLAEYSPGAELGWHRDVPSFEAVIGVSLHGAARLRLRRYPPRKHARAELAIDLEPRSAYVIADAARWQWQHAISPTKALRYSITFRTLARADAPFRR
jgi:alkylated DNA repair dioxygenase AlkB